MEPIIYKGRKIIPIMQPMLVWNNEEKDAIETFIYAKEDCSVTSFPWKGSTWKGGVGDGWKFAKPIPDKIELIVKVNGEEVSLKSISEETLLSIRNSCK